MNTKILGVSFHNLSPREACDVAVSFLDRDTPSTIFTPNPEMVMLTRRDHEFKEILNGGDLVVPDGIGVVYASRLTKNKIRSRVPGIELVIDLFDRIKDYEYSVYFLGAAPDVADAAAQAAQARFPGLRIAGTFHGYFTDVDDDDIINKINAANPDILLVGLGFPRQEKWIDRHKNRLNCKILMGVGGSFDVLSGKVRRAPKFFQRLGLEWLFRLLRQPHRIWRQRVLLKFILVVLFNRMRGKL